MINKVLTYCRYCRVIFLNYIRVILLHDNSRFSYLISGSTALIISAFVSAFVVLEQTGFLGFVYNHITMISNKHGVSRAIEDIKNISLSFAAIVALPLVIWARFSAHKSANAAVKSTNSDIYTKTVEQLASDKESIRLAAIYTFREIVDDSVSEDFQYKIVQVLYAFMKEHSRMVIAEYKNSVNSKNTDSSLRVLQEHSRYHSQFRAIIETLCLLQLVKITNRWRVNLSTDIWLSRTDLSHINFSHAELYCANLQYADLRYAKFKGTNLLNAKLEEANLLCADLSQSNNLPSANLKGSVYNSQPLDGDMGVVTKFPKNFKPEDYGMIDISRIGQKEEAEEKHHSISM